MNSPSTNDLLGQIEVFDSLELQAAEDYAVIEKELTNPEFKEIVDHIRVEELGHSNLCREILAFLRNRKES